MIRAFEAQVAAWAQQVAAESGLLFGAPAVVVGSLDPTAVPEGQLGILVAVTRLVPAPEHRDLGPAPVTADDQARVRAELTLAVVGPVAGADGLTVTPPGAPVHQADLLALSVLARLRERSKPGADGVVDWHGGSRGSVRAQAGDHMAALKWEAVEAREQVLVESAGQRRVWRLPLAATLEYRLATLPVDGGRIRAVGVHMDFVPADRLPLSFFAGMEGMLVQRLNGAGIHRLGDLAGHDAAALAADLSIADAATQQILADVVAVARTRESFEPAVPFTDALAEVLWLPARSLIQPTAAEDALLNRARRRPMEAIALAALGLSTAAILRPELLETVLLGRLLAQERAG